MGHSPLLIARAPAKVILTGEHSVVYGKPAIVLAVNRYAYTEIISENQGDISFTLLDFKDRVSATLNTLRALHKRIMESYYLFLHGSLSIREVLHKPVELFQYALVALIDTFHMELQKGLNIRLRSEIPIGCGMGSSAATIVSVIQALSSFFKIDINIEWLFRLSLEAERLQHGFSSGVDPYVSLHGGCVRFQKGRAVPCPPPRIPIYIVHTGKPITSTGDCVEAVSKAFGTSTIWEEFEHIATCFEQALFEEDIDSIKKLMSLNHKLLVQLGVVPEEVQKFIHTINACGGAAKICGAGATAGTSAGAVIVLDYNPQQLCKEHGFSCEEVTVETQGACLL